MMKNKEKNTNKDDNDTFEVKEQRYEDDVSSLEMTSNAYIGNYEAEKCINKTKTVIITRTQEVNSTGSLVAGVRTSKVDLITFPVTAASVDDDEDETTIDYEINTNDQTKSKIMTNFVDMSDFPSDWTIQHVPRRKGRSKGHVDRYYISPSKIRFRSIIEVRKFADKLSVCEGNEIKAYELWKQEQQSTKRKKRKEPSFAKAISSMSASTSEIKMVTSVTLTLDAICGIMQQRISDDGGCVTLPIAVRNKFNNAVKRFEDVVKRR